MLTVPCRRGFTLAEMMVVVVILLVVTGSVYDLLIGTQRRARAQTQRLNLQASVRSGSLAVVNELRELSTVAGGTSYQNDILSIGPAAMTYRAMRGIGFLCQTSSGNQIRIGRSGFTGHRDPEATRDGAYVFSEGNPDTDDVWLPLTITGVSTGSACPGAANAGITLTVPASPALPSLGVGTPVRIYEVMELKLYQAGGSSWLGARSVNTGEAIQPVVGPLTAGTGFRLEYLNELGLPTTDASAIKSIRVAIRGTVEAQPGALDPIPEEELITQVTLRNALRP